jgi:hypothetical protein
MDCKLPGIGFRRIALPLPSHEFRDDPSGIAFRLADVNLRVEAPGPILAVLAATLLNVPRFTSTVTPELTIEVAQKGDAWEIHGAGGFTKLLPRQSAPPQVGGAVVTSAIQAVAASRECTALRAAVVEKDGRALAMVGDDWESAISLATHLHARGWSYIGSDNALLDSAAHGVYCVQKSLYLNSSSVSQLPLTYRRAIEASPWYVTARGISFYAVDPSGAGVGLTWTPHATLCGIVVVDGAMADMPSLESLDRERLHEEQFARLRLDWTRVNAANLCIAGPIETCDLIEHWFASIQP